ncbi:MAG: methyltransferase domain-containing protein [Pseudomonadota bacterium]
MFDTVYDFKSFYAGKTGRVVRRILKDRIRELWPNLSGLSLVGTGYSNPYLGQFKGEAGHIFSIMPAGQGAHHWPHDGLNAVALSERAELPIETNSVDRVLMVHDLEFAEFLKPSLQEIWRVLKSNGRVLLIVPNRRGFWARADWSPFGHGTPYSVTQLSHSLRDNLFVHERTEEALFMPPIQYSPFLKSAALFERAGRNIFPIVAGVHIVEASKQTYAAARPDSGSKVRIRGRGIFMPKPVGNNYNRERLKRG